MGRRALTGAVAVALAASLLGGLALAATPPDLTGQWFNRDAPAASPWSLQSSPDRNALTASWHGDAATGHPTLRGAFSGTLSADATQYAGAMRVTEDPGVSVGGTMSFHI